jgi:hypothetical protein
MKPSKTILLLGTSLALGLVLRGVRAPLAASTPQNPSLLPEIVFVQAPEVVDARDLADRFPQGSRLVRLNPNRPDASVMNLTDGFFAATDPAVSPEGGRILFSGKDKADAPWQIWEMDLDGIQKRQITHCSSDCLRPAYLPHDQIVYSAMSANRRPREADLYVSETNGANPHAITFGPGDFQVETVLRSGRILISAESALVAEDQRALPRALYTIRPDGTGLMEFRPQNRENLIQSGTEELDNGTVLFVVKGAAVRQGSEGMLAWIKPGVLHNSLITPRQASYWSAHQLDESTLVVARTSSNPPSRNEKFDLYTFDLATRSPGRLIYQSPKFSSVQAVPLQPHATPRYYWSILHPQLKTGRVICLNAYLSASAPSGRLTTPIDRVRVLLLNSKQREEVVLGEAPVEKDGSFYVTVPADRAMRFELLDAKGQIIKAQRSWVWTRPGEDMGCLGCHDDKAMAPPNHWPMALSRFDTPIALGTPSPAGTAGH